MDSAYQPYNIMSTIANRLLDIWEVLATDTSFMGCVTESDIRYVRERTNREGLLFLTKTLPLLGKALDRSFETGHFECPPNFGRVKGTELPKLFHTSLTKLFLPCGKTLVDDIRVLYRIRVCDKHRFVAAVSCLRQLTLMFYKMNLPYTEDQTEVVKQQFIQTEIDLESLDSSIWANDCRLEVARLLIGHLLGSHDPLDIVPRHGSGASACKRDPWSRYKPLRFIPKLDRVYDYASYFYSGYNALTDCLDELQSLDVVEEPMARVCYVPKDSRGPRLISCEPCEFMYIQQGLMTKMYQAIEQIPNVRSCLSCLDQERNRNLAQLGSIDYEFATLDLKEASDRVSLELVEFLFPSNWVRAFTACRSTVTEFPDGTKVPMRKFAPMGSACCFPVEAIVFWALTMATVYGRDAIKMVFRSSPQFIPISVFGDDIILPSPHVTSVIEVFEKVGLLVNRSKSFARGPFRESCGGDYLLGDNVTPVRWNHVPIDSGSRNSMNYAKHRVADAMNNLIRKYGTHLTATLHNLLESWYGPTPVLTDDTPNGYYLIGDDRYLPVPYRSRPMPDRPGKPYFDRVQVYLDVEMSVRRQIETSDWSHVLRALVVTPGPEGSSIVAPAKRYKYGRRWVTV